MLFRSLKKGKDPKKDQTYFLYMIPQEQLKYTLFPLGGLTKPEVRELAESFNLFTAKKSESQEICFITKGNYKSFIESKVSLQNKSGNIIDSSGKIIGHHKGIYQYTLGQRKGLNISGPEPLYVLKIDPSNHTVMVGNKDELQTDQVVIKHVSTVNHHEPLVGRTFDLDRKSTRRTPVTRSSRMPSSA